MPFYTFQPSFTTHTPTPPLIYIHLQHSNTNGAHSQSHQTLSNAQESSSTGALRKLRSASRNGSVGWDLDSRRSSAVVLDGRRSVDGADGSSVVTRAGRLAGDGGQSALMAGSSNGVSGGLAALAAGGRSAGSTVSSWGGSGIRLSGGGRGWDGGSRSLAAEGEESWLVRISSLVGGASRDSGLGRSATATAVEDLALLAGVWDVPEERGTDGGGDAAGEIGFSGGGEGESQGGEDG